MKTYEATYISQRKEKQEIVDHLQFDTSNKHFKRNSKTIV